MDIIIFVILAVAIISAMVLRTFIRQRQNCRKQEDEVEVNDGSSLDTRSLSTGGAIAHEHSMELPDVISGGVENITVEVANISKSFGGREVVHDLSFVLKAGEVFGLVGPNGAGKSTTLRMLMDIIRPDSGTIRVFGESLREETKNRIGYLPEERGLYKKMRVTDSLVYLARLKNVDTNIAKKRAEELLKQVDMLAHKEKKVSELSRGMGQIIQFLVTIAHNPSLIVLDEPFGGLDPVNRMLIKDAVLDLKRSGSAIILSTHIMNEVEEMCDRILMIDRGCAVLYGNLSEIKWRYRNNSLIVSTDQDFSQIDGVIKKVDHGRHSELFLGEGADPQQVLVQLIDKGVRVDHFEISTPSLNDIFIQLVKR